MLYFISYTSYKYLVENMRFILIYTTLYTFNKIDLMFKRLLSTKLLMAINRDHYNIYCRSSYAGKMALTIIFILPSIIWTSMSAIMNRVLLIQILFWGKFDSKFDQILLFEYTKRIFAYLETL